MKTKFISLLTISLILNTLSTMPVNAGEGALNTAIYNGFQKNTDKKIEKANAAKDYSAEVTFMNNHLKLDKAFTKRYNELFAKGCTKSTLEECGYSDHEMSENSTKRTTKKSLEYYEQQMASATSIPQLGQIYACATTDFDTCYYIGGAGSTAKIINGGAKAIDTVANLGKTPKTNLSNAINDDVRTVIKDSNGTELQTDGDCSQAMRDNSKANVAAYLKSLENCEPIAQVTLSGYTEEDIKKLEDEYESKKANEQSLANRTLTAATTAATGIGGMQLAQGLAEQKADKAAEQDMDAYIATFRCTYGNGKQVKASSTEIELPGGNDANMMKYRDEYFALVESLRVRKEALGMTPGIEAEEILDKSQMGLYDDEFAGVTDGAYASLYRAKMLGDEEAQQEIDDQKEKSKTRVIAGGVAAGVGVVGGMVGNSLINGKLGEELKELKPAVKNKKIGKETQALLKKEIAALDDLKKCLDSAGVEDAEKLTFQKFYPSVLSIKTLDCNEGMIKSEVEEKSVNKLFKDSIIANTVLTGLTNSFTESVVTNMIDCDVKEDRQTCVDNLKGSLETVQKAFKKAAEKDKKEAKSLGIDLDNYKDNITGIGSVPFGGDLLSEITGTTEDD